MPRRNDISKILILGSGPIVIGQSAEFDYSGTQACKALKAEGYEVVLANSNPATIMTDRRSPTALISSRLPASISKKSSASSVSYRPARGSPFCPLWAGRQR